MILHNKYYRITEKGILEEVLLKQAMEDNPDCKEFELIIPNGITALGRFCIPSDYHKYITSISIPEGVMEIPNHFLNGGFELQNVNIPSSVKAIGDSAFYNCNKLSDICLPHGLEAIGNYAFALCKGLNRIELPDSIYSIGICAFAECDCIEKVTLSNNLKIISVHAFQKTVTDNMLTEYENCLYLGSTDNPYYMLYKTADNSLDKYHIHPDTRIINSNTFSWHNNLKSLALPKKLISIGRDAFGYCKNLTKISIPDSVISIGECAFGNSKLKTVSFGKKLTNLPVDIFNCPLGTINYRGTNQEFLAINKQYGWVDPYQVITINCKDDVIVKDKRNMTRYKYKKLFDD